MVRFGIRVDSVLISLDLNTLLTLRERLRLLSGASKQMNELPKGENTGTQHIAKSEKFFPRCMAWMNRRGFTGGFGLAGLVLAVSSNQIFKVSISFPARGGRMTGRG